MARCTAFVLVKGGYCGTGRVWRCSAAETTPTRALAVGTVLRLRRRLSMLVGVG